MTWNPTDRKPISGRMSPSAIAFYSDLAAQCNMTWGGKPQPLQAIEAIALDPEFSLIVRDWALRKFPKNVVDNPESGS